MNKVELRRPWQKWLWGLLLFILVLIPVLLVMGKYWLRDHLEKNLVFGTTEVRMVNPVVSWNLHFRSDSILLQAPKWKASAENLQGNLRFWESLFNLRPNLEVALSQIEIKLPKDSLSAAEKRRRRKNSVAWIFPNLRFPFSCQIRVSQIKILADQKPLADLKQVNVYTQGPKGVALEVEHVFMALVNSDLTTDSQIVETDSISNSSDLQPLDSLPGKLKLTARWFGKSLRYQFQFQNEDGDFLHLEGSHAKSNLKNGEDSVDLKIESTQFYTNQFSKTNIPDFTNLRIQGSVVLDSHLVVRAHSKFTAPAFFLFGAEHIDLKISTADSSGKIVANVKGDSGESLYLQGLCHVSPRDTMSIQEIFKTFTGTFSGNSHNLHMTLGKKKMPLVVEVSRLKIFPGMIAEADIKTKDNSLLHLHAFRDTSWKLNFEGEIDPTETWAKSWTDTNVHFKKAHAEGKIFSGGVAVEAWLQNVQAYGAVADSVYVKQSINKNGYYLLDSRLTWKGDTWPIQGKVEWGKINPGVSGRHVVSLEFNTKHPTYGVIHFTMPTLKNMTVNADGVAIEKLPYTHLNKLLPYQPIVSGDFSWSWLARTGHADIQTMVIYHGQKLKVNAVGNWDSQYFNLTHSAIAYVGSQLNVSGQFQLHGKQFYELKGFGISDIEALGLSANQFDAAKLTDFLGSQYPIKKGFLNGRLDYSANTGFKGQYDVDSLQFRSVHKLYISKLELRGSGNELELFMRTGGSPNLPWLNDSISLTLKNVLGSDPQIHLMAKNDDGLSLNFEGHGLYQKQLEGKLNLSGRALLPGAAGEIKDLSLAAQISVPFTPHFLQTMKLDSGLLQARYAVPGLDTQNISGGITIFNGVIKIDHLEAKNKTEPTLNGEVAVDLNTLGRPKVTAKLQADNLGVQWPGLQKLVLKAATASLIIDSSGLNVHAQIGNADIKTVRDQLNMRGELVNLKVDYFLPFASSKSVYQSAIQRLQVKSEMRNLFFQHKVSFEEIQKYFRSVKSSKKRQHSKPIDLAISLQTQGTANRVETDILRMYFRGELNIHGIYPYTLLSGEFSSLSGELGQSNQSYDISSFDLKWQNNTLEEGRIALEGGKRLKFDCKPETKRTCNVYVMLDGRLDEMAFTYDSDCGSNSGEAIEPSALINSVSRGCFSDQYVAGTGGGNYGEAVVNFLEPTLNEKLSSVGNKYSLGWIKSTQVSGIGTIVSSDTIGGEPVAIGIQSKEKWGMTLKAKTGYHPEKKVPNPWENKVALEWRPPLEKVAHNSEWKKLVRDRVMLEVSAENRPEEKIVDNQEQQIRKQVGLRYHYKFWDLW